MRKYQFQFKLMTMVLVVALLSVPMLLLKSLTRRDTTIVAVCGAVHFRQDDAFEVKAGAVRIRQDNTQTEIHADRIVVQRDGTAEVYGPGTIRQMPR
jgi:hypothetical protein